MSLFSFFRKNKQDTHDGAGASDAVDEPAPARARSRRKASGAEPEDPILPEKKRARRRLTGAVALVLAVVIGLPMILDPEPKRPVQDIEISIPSRDQAPLARRLPAAAEPAEAVLEPVESSVAAAPVAAPPAVAAPAAAEKPAVPASDATPAAAGRSREAAAPARTATAAPATPALPPSTETPARKPPSPAPAATPAPSAASAQDSRDREAARALAILEGKPVPAAGAAKPARYTVQVAALASQEKIDELRNKLKAAGIASQTSKVPTAGGERTRVRVGPFASKEDAEAMRARLVKLGLNGTLVPLD